MKFFYNASRLFTNLVASRKFILCYWLLLTSACKAVSLGSTQQRNVVGETATSIRPQTENTTAAELRFYTSDRVTDNSRIPIMPTLVTQPPNSTTSSLLIMAGRTLAYGKASTYSKSTNQSNGGLSDGAIAGIVIGVLALLCFCLCCGGAAKSGHWENARVWVQH